MADRTRPRQSQPAREGISWRPWVLAIAVVLLAIIVIQNSQEVRVKILFGDFDAPLILILLITAGLGALIGYVAPMLRRGRR